MSLRYNYSTAARTIPRLDYDIVLNFIFSPFHGETYTKLDLDVTSSLQRNRDPCELSIQYLKQSNEFVIHNTISCKKLLVNFQSLLMITYQLFSRNLALPMFTMCIRRCPSDVIDEINKQFRFFNEKKNDFFLKLKFLL